MDKFQQFEDIINEIMIVYKQNLFMILSGF